VTAFICTNFVTISILRRSDAQPITVDTFLSLGHGNTFEGVPTVSVSMRLELDLEIDHYVRYLIVKNACELHERINK